MKMDEKFSSFGIVLQCLGRIWEPAGAAIRVKRALGVRSLEETTGALGRAGMKSVPLTFQNRLAGSRRLLLTSPI